MGNRRDDERPFHKSVNIKVKQEKKIIILFSFQITVLLETRSRQRAFRDLWIPNET